MTPNLDALLLTYHDANWQMRLAGIHEAVRRATYFDDDSDGDGVADPGDVFPDDPTEWADTDADGVLEHLTRVIADQAAAATIPSS